MNPMRPAYTRGKEIWTSLEELAASPELEEYLKREFAPGAEKPPAGLSRRRFLQLMGASLALAGITGCGRKVGLPGGRSVLLPYVKPPEELVPGRPVYFATTMVAAGDALGLLGETHMGRPTKMEGNPSHPAALGATDTFAQASVLDLYDPARLRTVAQGDRIRDWGSFGAFLLGRREALLPARGKGLRILTGAIDSPSLEAGYDALLKTFPEARVHSFEPVDTVNARSGAGIAFGRPLRPILHLDRAEVIVSIGADFLGWGAGKVRHAHDWAERRKVREVPEAGGPGMSRLYAAESHFSVTGAVADHRLPVPPSRLPELLRRLAAELGVLDARDAQVPREGTEGPAPGDGGDGENTWLKAAAADLRSRPGRGLVLAGEPLPPEAHATAHAINAALGAFGTTITFIESNRDPSLGPSLGSSGRASGSLDDLVREMRQGQVDALIILDSNPVYTAPADLEFAAALARVPHTASLAYYDDETASLCAWRAPLSHYLESWGDARAFDGTVSLIQPLMEQLVPSRTPAEILAMLQGDPDPDPAALLREYWRPRLGPDPDAAWRESLYAGFIRNSAPLPVTAALAPDWQARLGVGMSPAAGQAGLEIEFRPDPAVWDGRFAFNPWLQETPKPMSKLTWDNAVYLSPATAAAQGVGSRDMVELEYRGRRLEAPVWVLPGQCDGVATVTLGYGRAWPGARPWTDGNGGFADPGDTEREVFGYNAYALRTSDATWSGTGLRMRRTGAAKPLACAQDQTALHGRSIIRAADHSQLLADPEFTREEKHASLYPEFAYDTYAWGMTIDMSVCTGCSACVTACRAENNIPVVGKEGVLRHRDMNWLRIDRYFSGVEDRPDAYFQPMLCQHCEKAPCEAVCPVGATVHSGEGLNEMIYNRCIGTRYCSNNCPYKVRRFNFFDYVDGKSETPKLQRNPDVTVRGRGVMEKCTFCVQRIGHARIEAEKENRRIRDGEAMTACMQACPTSAIIFGDLNDGNAHVRDLRRLPWKYAVLGDLNTQPRISYLAKIWNRSEGIPASREGLPL